LKPFRLKAIVLIPKAVNQINTKVKAAKKKCKERELLKLAYWKIRKIRSKGCMDDRFLKLEAPILLFQPIQT
jgi:hypothetical protein